MGFTPQQVGQMSMWQFFAALNGYVEANSPKTSEKLTDTEADDLFDWITSDADGPRVLTTQTYWWEGDDPEPAGVVSFAIT